MERKKRKKGREIEINCERKKKGKERKVAANFAFSVLVQGTETRAMIKAGQVRVVRDVFGRNFPSWKIPACLCL